MIVQCYHWQALMYITQNANSLSKCTVSYNKKIYISHVFSGVSVLGIYVGDTPESMGQWSYSVQLQGVWLRHYTGRCQQVGLTLLIIDILYMTTIFPGLWKNILISYSVCIYYFLWIFLYLSFHRKRVTCILSYISTGSSLMHQKNTDSLELIRGKAGRIFGYVSFLKQFDRKL